MTPDDVTRFWFEELTPKQWFTKDLELDERMAQRFGATLDAASRCELYSWRTTPGGRLAEVIVLDQFSRNVHRGTPRAFAQDPLALALAQEAVAGGIDQRLPSQQRTFLLMPYMHSESALVHEEAVRLFGSEGPSQHLDYELAHKAIVDRFGRYPHRNEILGRVSTPEELEFLKQPGSGF